MASISHHNTTASGIKTIVCTLEYSSTRVESGVQLKYRMYLYRDNTSYSGEATNGGTTYYYVRVNGSNINSGNKSITVPNDGTRVYLFGSADSYLSHTVSDGVFDSGSFTLSFETTNSMSIENLIHSSSTTVSYSSYASSVKAGSISITDNGNNTYTIKSTTGSSGTNNDADNCHIYYTTDGSAPSSSNGTGINTGKKAGQTYSTTLSVSSNKTIKAIAYTIGTYNNVATSVASQSVKYYHAPSERPTPSITFNNTKKPTLKSKFTISWEAGTPFNSDSYNKIKGYRVRLIKQDNTYGIKFRDDCIADESSSDYMYESSEAGSITVDYSLPDMGISVGDVLHVTLHIWSEDGTGKRLYYASSSPAKSNYITIVNIGVVWLRIGNTWVEGQVWSRDGSTWDECTGLFIRDSSTWKESTN